MGAGAGWGVWHHYAGKGKPTAAAQTETVETLDESKSVFVTLPETIVTLHDNNGADHYLSAELVMVVASDKEAVILRAPSGSKVFSAGHDIHELPSGGRDPLSYDDPLRQITRMIQKF
ncbi:hypothetical protein O5964_27665, partial [Escherichia coli]|nr:hypothetical protein [Escherichia coli]